MPSHPASALGASLVSELRFLDAKLEDRARRPRAEKGAGSETGGARAFPAVSGGSQVLGCYLELGSTFRGDAACRHAGTVLTDPGP